MRALCCSQIHSRLQQLDSTNYLEYREHTFLQHPLVPRHLLWDKETVYFLWRQQRKPATYITGTFVTADGKLTDAALRDQLAAVQSTRLLHFENLQPHTFAGFVSRQVRSSTACMRSCMYRSVRGIATGLAFMFSSALTLLLRAGFQCFAAVWSWASWQPLIQMFIVQDNEAFEAFHAGMRWEQKWCVTCA